MFKDFNEFVDWAAGRILCDLMKEGGPGLRSAVCAIINAYANWQTEQKASNSNPKAQHKGKRG